MKLKAILILAAALVAAPVYADDKHHGHDGGYQDIYLRTADGWRYKERIHVHPPQIPGEYKGVPNSELDAESKAASLSPAVAD